MTPMPLAPAFSRLCVDLLEAGRRVRFRVRGPSMSPAICDGDLVTVTRVAPPAIRRGDVLLYASERGLTAHRVIGRLRGPEVVFRVRGDAVGSPTETVTAARVLGRVEAVERCGREHPVGGAPSPLARLASRLWRRLSPV